MAIVVVLLHRYRERGVSLVESNGLVTRKTFVAVAVACMLSLVVGCSGGRPEVQTVDEVTEMTDVLTTTQDAPTYQVSETSAS